MAEEEHKKKPMGISRRDFLKSAGIAVGGAAMSSTVLAVACTPAAPAGTDTPSTTTPGTTTTVIKEVPPKLTKLNVNGWAYELQVASNRTLAEVLRDQLGLTGTKIGCNMGGCAMCTVLVEGKPTLACASLAVECDGKRITTIEGLSDPATGALDPIQQAFLDHGAVECGFCTPGAIITVKALLAENPHPTDPQIRDALASNLCCCHSTPFRVIEAVLALGK